MDWRLRAVELGMRLSGPKRRLSSADATRSDIEGRVVRPTSFAPPRGVARATQLSVTRIAGATVYRVGPQRAQPVGSRVVYLHGGGYTAEVSPRHWRFVRQIAERCEAEVTVPIYPLAPTATAEETVPLVGRILDEACVRAGAQPVVAMGDSAGGGLALAVAQRRLAAGLPPPRLILISPWLDATLADPAVADIEPNDGLLGRPGLAESARMYAGDLRLDDPLVSPLFGPVAGLADIDVFTGTADLLNPDAHRLAQRCADAGVTCRVHEASGMPHVYPLLPLLPAAVAAREEIFSLVRFQA